jgi:hypothetical protein
MVMFEASSQTNGSRIVTRFLADVDQKSGRMRMKIFTKIQFRKSSKFSSKLFAFLILSGSTL